MKLKNLFISGALAASALGAGAAMAVPAQFITGAGNEFTTSVTLATWGTPKVEGLFADQISFASLGALGSYSVFHVDIFGGEAGYTNSFTFGSLPGQTYTHTSGNDLNLTPVKSWDVLVGTGALLNFKFVINGGDLNNGSNPGEGLSPNFFSSYGSNLNLRPDLDNSGFTDVDGKYVWLFLDDAGAGPDDNHDDLIVRISYVPEPATLGLLGLGLVGLGALRRRKTA